MRNKKLIKLERKLKRLKLQIAEMSESHEKNREILNYHAGFSFGYLKGKESQLEERIDDIKEIK